MKNLHSLWKVLVAWAALGLSGCSGSEKDSGEGGNGCDGFDCGDGDVDEIGPPEDLTPYFEEIEARCAGLFTGYGLENGDPVVVPCRYDGLGYALEVHLDGEPACEIEGEEADCTNATSGTFGLLGELVSGGDTYVVTGYAGAHSVHSLADDLYEVGVHCGYQPEDSDLDELPHLEEYDSDMDVGITSISWRHEEYDGEDYVDYEYCSFVMEEHTPPG